MGLILLKLLKICVQLIIITNTPFQTGFSSGLRFRRLKDVGHAAPEAKGLSEGTALPHSEPAFPVISAMISKIQWGAQFNMHQAHWAELLGFFPP